MGRFKKICHNQHWCKSDPKAAEGRLPAYKYLVAFRSIAKERGERYDRIRFICESCISVADLKRDFTRHLKQDISFLGAQEVCNEFKFLVRSHFPSFETVLWEVPLHDDFSQSS